MPSEGDERLQRPTLFAGLAGAVGAVGLAVTGQAQPGPAITVALLVAGAGFLLARRSVGAAEQARPLADQPAPPAAAIPFTAILEGLDDPVMVVEAGEGIEVTGHRLVFANVAAREIFRVHKPDARLITVIRNPQVIELVDEALFGGRAGHVAFEAGGTQDRLWTAVARPLGATPWNAPLALLVLRDQTDLRRAERMRADFLANASHELRTPLASLSGFIETLRGPARNDVDARDKFLGIMQTQAERMARLIDDLMSLSRIELSEHIAPQGRIDFAGAITDVADALTPVLKAKGVTLDWTSPPRGSVTVEGDRDQIIQVIQNLVDNAVKYTPSGGIIHVDLAAPVSGDPPRARDPDAARMALLNPEHRPGERYALLRVADDGPGMPRDALPRLTERFYRVEGQKSGDKSGTGLGLAIVKHIVNRHRGGLAAETALGSGSTFSVWLPLSDAPAEAPAIAVVKAS